MPVTIKVYAEEYAESKVKQRIDHLETERLSAGDAKVHHMLTAGAVTDEQAAARREQIERRVADTAKMLREINANQPKRQGSWRHTDRAIGHQRIADGHWDTPPAKTDD
jgi:maltooligosyltrehalose synthase